MDLASVAFLVLKAAFSVAVLYGFYRVALRKEMHFATNRVFLLLSMLVSGVIPFITITIIQNVVMHEVAPSITVLESSQSMGVTTATLDQPLSLVEMVGVAYLAVTGCMLLRLLVILLNFILSVSRNSRRETINGTTVLVSNRYSQTFSFFGVVVMPENDYLRADSHLLVAHEQVHSRQLHSIDLLLAELFIAIQWFNPISYLLRDSLHEVHEYLADRCVIRSGADQLRYKRLLLDCITTANMPTLSSSFSAKLSKRRFAMISKTYNSGNQKYKFLLALPIVVALFALFSLKVEAKYIYTKPTTAKVATTAVPKDLEVINAPQPNQDTASIIKLTEKCHSLVPDGTLLKDFEMLQVKSGEERKYSLVLTKGTRYSLASANNANNLIPVWLVKSGTEKEVLPSLKMDPTKEYSMTVLQEITETAVYDIVVKNATTSTFDMVASLFFMGQFEIVPPKKSSVDSAENKNLVIEPTDDETFFVVEDMPTFNNQGINHAREYIQKNIVFPEAIKATGIKGKVYVSFVVNEEGRVVQVKIVRGLVPSLDKAVVTAVSGMPQWTPGKQRGKAVKVAFTVPVSFE